MTDWTIVLNAATSVIGLASSRTAVFVWEFCMKSAMFLLSFEVFFSFFVAGPFDILIWDGRREGLLL
jgi:hypothetical protein